MHFVLFLCALFVCDVIVERRRRPKKLLLVMGSSYEDEVAGSHSFTLRRGSAFLTPPNKREGVLFIFEAVLVIEDINDNKF